MSFLTDRPFDPTRLLAEVSDPGCGASLLFLGTGRRSAEDGPVEGIDYSAYLEMAEAELAAIVVEARARWPAARIALRHRTGWVPTGEASVAIAVACPHRVEAYEVSRYVIEETKKRVPLWKQERTGDGTLRWVDRARA
jgi:molybdopterin synthase catalytic subunit